MHLNWIWYVAAWVNTRLMASIACMDPLAGFVQINVVTPARQMTHPPTPLTTLAHRFVALASMKPMDREMHACELYM